MIKKALVKHQHLYTKDEAILYEGDIVYNVYEDYEELLYRDEENARVRVLIYEKKLCIIRQGEVQSILNFEEGKTMESTVKSVYGDIILGIHTHFYRRDNNIIEVAYDVADSANKEGFHIIFEIKEDVHEYH